MAPTLRLTLNVTFSMLHLNFRLKTVKNLYLGDELKARYYHCEERKILYWTLNLEIFESKLWHSVTHFTDCGCVVPKFCLWGFPSLCKQDEGKFGDKIHWSRSLPVKQMSNCLPGTLQSSQPFLNPIQSILQLVGRDGGRYLMLHIPPWIAIEA